MSREGVEKSSQGPVVRNNAAPNGISTVAYPLSFMKSSPFCTELKRRCTDSSSASTKLVCIRTGSSGRGLIRPSMAE